jgi:hypothetical protein
MSAGALLVWAFTFNVDRNLQAFLPLLVAVTAALLVQLWRLGWVARAGLIPLVALQVIWGGDALFYSSHDRLRFRSEYLALDDALPESSTVLLHSFHVSLGINRKVVLDWTGFQGLVSYESVRTPRELFDYYRARGITHLLDVPGLMGAPSKQEEVLFHALRARHGLEPRQFGRYRLTALPKTPPPAQAPFLVLCLGIGYKDGLYPIERLGTNEYLPAKLKRIERPKESATSDNRAALIARADAVVIGRAPSWDETRNRLGGDFERAVDYPGFFSVYVRR